MTESNSGQMKTRGKAAGIHLLISLCLAGIVACLLYFIWFPEPWFAAAGASTLILVLMGVDVCLGPLLTAIVFNPRKSRRLLRMDVGVIALCQAIAFGYGFWVIVQARPVFVVAAVDRYVLVSADLLADKDLELGRQPAFRHRGWTGPKLVGAVPPHDERTPQRVMDVLAGGKDIDQLPEFYVPYAEVADKLMQRTLPMEWLQITDPDQRARVRALQDTATRNGYALRYLPLQHLDKSFTAIVNMRTRQPIAVLSLDPWDATRETSASGHAEAPSAARPAASVASPRPST